MPITYTFKTTNDKDFYSRTERTDIRVYMANALVCHVRFTTTTREGCVQREVCWHSPASETVLDIDPGRYTEPYAFINDLERKHGAKMVRSI